jgi:hypothetical protein
VSSIFCLPQFCVFATLAASSLVYASPYPSKALEGAYLAQHHRTRTAVAVIYEGLVVRAGQALLLLLGPFKLGKSPHHQ